MPPVATQLGDYLRATREALGLSLREVERRTEIHNAHLSQIESGVIERPAPHILWTLATTYGIDYDELMRMAGHVGTGAPSASRPAAAAALSAYGLSQDQEREVLEFIKGLKKKAPEGDI
jgi:transcriptional regulator with XRE-family HTH domain